MADQTGPKRPAGTFATPSRERPSTVDRAAGELRRALFDGEIAPGSPLREVALAGALGVSRSTIREALGVLVGEGLATREPNRGVFVTELDPDAVGDVGRARAIVELAGVRRWSQAGEAARDAVRRALAHFEDVASSHAAPSRLTAAHLAIHRSFAGLNESPRLAGFADALYAEIRLGLARVDRIRRNAPEQVTSHHALVDLLEGGDADAVSDALAAHLRHAEASMLEALGPHD